MKFLVYICFFGVLIGGMASFFRSEKLKKENSRLTANQNTLRSEIEYYRTSDSLNAASVGVLTYTAAEFKKYCGELTGEIEALNLKIKRLQSISRTALQTDYKVTAILRDSIVPKNVPNVPKAPNVPKDTLKCLNFTNNWVDISGCINSDTIGLSITTRDTLITIAHRIPKKFLFFRFGTKAIRQEVISKNPHSKIVFTEYIILNS